MAMNNQYRITNMKGEEIRIDASVADLLKGVKYTDFIVKAVIDTGEETRVVIDINLIDSVPVAFFFTLYGTNEEGLEMALFDLEAGFVRTLHLLRLKLINGD